MNEETELHNVVDSGHPVRPRGGLRPPSTVVWAAGFFLLLFGLLATLEGVLYVTGNVRMRPQPPSSHGATPQAQGSTGDTEGVSSAPLRDDEMIGFQRLIAAFDSENEALGTRGTRCDERRRNFEAVRSALMPPGFALRKDSRAAAIRRILVDAPANIPERSDASASQVGIQHSDWNSDFGRLLDDQLVKRTATRRDVQSLLRVFGTIQRRHVWLTEQQAQFDAALAAALPSIVEDIKELRPPVYLPYLSVKRTGMSNILNTERLRTADELREVLGNNDVEVRGLAADIDAFVTGHLATGSGTTNPPNP